MSTSGAVHLAFGTIPLQGGFYPYYYTYYVFAACVYNGSSWEVRRIKDSSGSMINSGAQHIDMAFCSGAGDDDVQLFRNSSSCGGVSFHAWNYGWNQHWFEFWAQSGRDTVRGGNGRDLICGGTGDEGPPVGTPIKYILHGAHGADDIDGWTGDDHIDAYQGSGDLGWGYDGNDHVLDLVYGPGDAVFGEDDDDCVFIDEGPSSATPNWQVNGGRATCNPGTCSCGTTNDNSCSDTTENILSTTTGCEVYDPVGCSYD